MTQSHTDVKTRRLHNAHSTARMHTHTTTHKMNKRKCARPDQTADNAGLQTRLLSLISGDTYRDTPTGERSIFKGPFERTHRRHSRSLPLLPHSQYIFKGHPLTFHSHRPVCDLLLSAHTLKNTAPPTAIGEERREK